MSWNPIVRGLACLACLGLFAAPLAAGEAEPKKEETAPLKPPDYSSPKATLLTLWEGAKAGNRERVLSCFDGASRNAITEFEKIIADAVKETPELKQHLGDGDMVAKMSAEIKKKEPKFGEEKIDGDKATLQVTVDEKEETLPFVREQGAWKFKLPGEMPTPEKMRAMIGMMKAMVKQMKEAKEGKKE